MAETVELVKCAWCDQDFDVEDSPSDELCDECDERCVWCSICEEWNCEDDTCRHVFRDSSWEWNGSGGYGGAANVKDAFVKLILLMPTGFAESLRGAIIADEFYSFLSAPMIGSGGWMDLHGVKDPPDTEFNYFGNALLRIGEGEHAEETSDGYNWLASLYKGKTLWANQITVDWLSEIMRGPNG